MNINQIGFELRSVFRRGERRVTDRAVREPI